MQDESMEGINISLEEIPKPNQSTIKNRRSKMASKAKSKMTLKERIQIEETFFKINYYFGGTLETEIEKVIPRLIDQFKDKDDDMGMDMGDLAGMVRLTRTNTRSISGRGNGSLRRTRTTFKNSLKVEIWVDLTR